MVLQNKNKTTKLLTLCLPNNYFHTMQAETDVNKMILPHHEQQPLCTTRLPYRQGRKLTAVKVYTVANESNHLLIFGVPALNIRQETRAHFMKFGKLLQFNISHHHVSEPFTETYHAQYERIQSARIAKRMLDARNFYGGCLHVCYAPEMESVEETKQKLRQRQNDVLYRLRNLQSEVQQTEVKNTCETKEKEVKKLNMGAINTISLDKAINKSKRKRKSTSEVKRFKPCFTTLDNSNTNVTNCDTEEPQSNRLIYNEDNLKSSNIVIQNGPVYKDNKHKSIDTPVDVVDCTSVENEVITNINEHLNYDKFGNEDVRRVPKKPVNRIIFNVNKNS